MLIWVIFNHANWIGCNIFHTVNIIFVTTVIAIRNQRLHQFWYFPNRTAPAVSGILKDKDLTFIWTQEVQMKQANQFCFVIIIAHLGSPF